MPTILGHGARLHINSGKKEEKVVGICTKGFVYLEVQELF